MFPSIDITCPLTAFITGLKGKQAATHLPSFQRLMLNLLTGAEACLARELSGVHPITICVCSWGIPSAKPFTGCHCSPGVSVLVCRKSSHMLEKKTVCYLFCMPGCLSTHTFPALFSGYTSWFLRQIHSSSPVLLDTWPYQLPSSCHTSSLSCLERD